MSFGKEKDNEMHMLLPDMRWQHGGLWVDLQGVVRHVERCANSFKMFCTSHLLLYFFRDFVFFIINFDFHGTMPPNVLVPASSWLSTQC